MNKPRKISISPDSYQSFRKWLVTVLSQSTVFFLFWQGIYNLVDRLGGDDWAMGGFHLIRFSLNTLNPER